ncbi:MAG TPA: S41 family peptidase [Herpetosiphonaceae bacterium]
MAMYNQEQPPRRSLGTLLGWVGALILVIGASLGGGFFLGREYQRRNPDTVAVSSSLDSANLAAGRPVGSASQGDLDEQFKVFWEVWDLVGKEFYHTEPINQQKMVYGAIRGMLQSLGDDFTGFQEPEAAERSREDMQGAFEGIGAYVEFKDGQVLIVSPIEGSPAERAELRPGDVILAVDGKLMTEVTDGLSRDEAIQAAVKLIRGTKGTKVVLSLLRPSSSEKFDKEIIRDAIPLISVRSSMIGDVGYIQLSEFKANSQDELDKAIAKLKPSNPKAIIFDLRNNPGGYVDTARNILGRFVEEGVTHLQESSDGTQKEYTVLRDGNAEELYDIPVLVLVNGGSASASEIVSGAFQDQGRAKLLGEKTFGKGSVQSLHKLSDNAEARITIAHWLTPKKRAIHKVGIEPDYVVPFSDDASQFPVECILNQRPAEGQTACGDSQLFWALKVLKGDGTPPPAPATPVAPTPTPGK